MQLSFVAYLVKGKVVPVLQPSITP